MKRRIVQTLCLLATLLVAFATPHASAADAAFTFADAQYFHRYSNNDLYEFTPAGQEDLKTWTDMVTINRYPNAKDGDGLATMANAVLGNYKAHKAFIIKTDSLIRIADRPAEHLVVAVLQVPGIVETIFVRFKMHDGIGISIISAHRMYGESMGNQMSAWLKQNGQAREDALMRWNGVPKLR